MKNKERISVLSHGGQTTINRHYVNQGAKITNLFQTDFMLRNHIDLVVVKVK